MKYENIEVAQYAINDLSVGQEAGFSVEIHDADIDNFAELSGDINPLHMSFDFATRKGFTGRVVHGGLLVAMISRLVGVYLPGLNSLLSSVNVKFKSPVISGSSVRITGVVSQISEAVNMVVLKVKISDLNTNNTYATAEIVVRVNQ